MRNDEISTVLLHAAADHEGHRRLALERASKEAWRWSEEAGDVAASGRELTTLRSVGPWVADLITGWLEDPPEVPEPDETRRDFLTFAQVSDALRTDPSWGSTPHGDLQMHTTDSDGRLPLPEMVGAAERRRAFVSITDHSQSLTVAGGMDVGRLREQGQRIAALNETLEAAASSFRVLRSIEMDVFDAGEGDMEPDALAELDVVLGAFHSKLRRREDGTERYLAALRNPTVHVLAHPTTRMFDRRLGLVADWPRVFAEAARLGTAVEIDGSPRRQDLSVTLARVALAEGVTFSMGSDAHSAEELVYLETAMAIAALAGIPKDRILNYRGVEEVRAWAASLRDERGGSGG